MILEKLSKMEMETAKVITDEQKKMDAIKTVKELLNQIDLSVEVIPERNVERLKNLLSSLKGKELSEYEKILVKEIQNY